ncbi:hypothetical protein GA0070609_4437 [Micromonospora echinaurantiaca]|uniref:Uncharacterized protein n=1 Tax=Micromonospora echinaurantiaca TaxID=47857 RepID=A0A1C5JGI3_9ACTN|nr:hypothetical protein [Micromonospora echinaurantiaca]SCG69694.1 hypothetical protein GA0070609_4437 [Micromonospora echinaurantiaca]
MIETLTYASHTAHLDPMTGEGLLVLPRVADDIDLGGMVSLHAADWDHVIGDLSRRGWQPSEDDDGDLVHIGTTADGRPVIGLYGRQPVTSLPSVDQAAEAWRDLLAVAQVVTE